MESYYLRLLAVKVRLAGDFQHSFHSSWRICHGNKLSNGYRMLKQVSEQQLLGPSAVPNSLRFLPRTYVGRFGRGHPSIRGRA